MLVEIPDELLDDALSNRPGGIPHLIGHLTGERSVHRVPDSDVQSKLDAKTAEFNRMESAWRREVGYVRRNVLGLQHPSHYPDTALIVAVYDPHEDKVMETQVIADDYVVTCAGSCYTHRIQTYGNGTHVLTIKGRKLPDIDHDFPSESREAAHRTMRRAYTGKSESR